MDFCSINLENTTDVAGSLYLVRLRQAEHILLLYVILLALTIACECEGGFKHYFVNIILTMSQWDILPFGLIIIQSEDPSLSPCVNRAVKQFICSQILKEDLVPQRLTLILKSCEESHTQVVRYFKNLGGKGGMAILLVLVFSSFVSFFVFSFMSLFSYYPHFDFSI